MTTGGLARRLGVSPTTLRSWDRRYGLGPAVRADGRHRRWTPRDVAVLEAMCRLTSAGVPPAEAARAAQEAAAGEGAARGGGAGAAGEAAAERRTAVDGTGPAPAGRSAAVDGEAPPERLPPAGGSPAAGARPAVGGLKPGSGRRSHAAGALPLGDVRQECRGLARAAVRLDAPAVDGQLASAVERYGLAVAWEEVMVPTLHAVGRKWASSGDRYVEVEHLLSWHVSTALRRVTPSSRAATPWDVAQGPVVLACLPGEQHTLPLEALNAGLTERGLPTRMFGAAVPLEALTAAVRRVGPAAVVLWAQGRSTASIPLARHIAATQWGVRGARSQPTVVLGGPGWAGRSARGMVRPSSLTEALSVLTARYESGARGRPADGPAD
ncbi:MerR family transcriptional regulator [Streptomyces sp. Qhu-G9]|uniref:MerR family transcriptional regulator n=1 Tax=Streptomyces sp. Qhu-G9 TaxID=3452799 RepID=UPI0022AC55FE|nr:MerR family transcriptional regulator [Streptomyces aurantiacus]WAU86314.1 MerR family transcriptional regulator [Streptomyces aurantiacus]